MCGGEKKKKKKKKGGHITTYPRTPPHTSESLKCKNEDHGKNAKTPVTAGMKEQGSSEDRKGKGSQSTTYQQH